MMPPERAMRVWVAVSTFLILAGCATGSNSSDVGRPVPAAQTQPPTQAVISRSAPPVPSRMPPPPRTRPQPGDARADRTGSLFERLGGKTAITTVVDNFLRRVSKDERINARFINADLSRLRGLLVDLICQATGGPCQYTGRDMRAAHAGMRIAGDEFDALVQNLQAALDHLRVPSREQDDLLGLLAPMKSDITQSGSAEASATSAADFMPLAPTVAPAPAPPAPTAATLPTVTPAVAVAASEAVPPPPADPVTERAQAIREATSLLEKANIARLRGNRSFAEQLFSSAELIMGSDAVATLAPLFREGAPPRVLGPVKVVPRDSPPQPPTVGNSDDEAPVAPKVQRGLLSGSILLPQGRPLVGLAVVTLEPASGKFSRRRPTQRVIEQRNREFAPRVMAVPVGSTVSFPNFDAIYHNVFSRSKTRSFDLGLYKAGQSRELVFDKEGVVRVGCNLHANMSAYVVAVAAPHYAVTDARGRFTFRSVAPGRYRLRTWLEGSDTPVAQEVQIKARPNTVIVTVTSNAAGVPQTDKFGALRGGASRK